tara:strand:- start:368 stop:658 length:291 start_codon:yes stop_codon:yes gene_type:complete
MRQLLEPLSAEPSLRPPAGSATDQHGEHGEHGEQAQLGAAASDYLLPRGLTASTGKRPKPVGADDDDDDEHLVPEAGGERRRRRGPTTLVFRGEQA